MSPLIETCWQLVEPWSLFLVVLGTTAGVLVGAIPGLTGAMLISLSLPLTYGMAPEHALILLISMYVGSISGGLITATLLRMPGTPASIMTTLDGYPMAQGGQPGRALGLGVSASFVGGVISWILLVLLARPMALAASQMTKFEFFSLTMMAMALIAAVSGRSLAKGMLSGVLGMLAAMSGTAPTDGQVRWTLGFHQLNNGLELLPTLIGVFAISQVFKDIVELHREPERVAASTSGIRLKLADWRRHAVNLVRSSFIGSWVGILPGIGANIGSVLAYTAARYFSKEPEKFGHGSEEGIVASEAGNNATVGGALVPLISMGIPGSVIDAILLGALVIHKLQPGPLLFRDNPGIVYTIMGAALLANIFMFVLMIASVGSIAKLMTFPRWLLTPLVIMFCVVGSYALNNRLFDVGVMLAFGVVGFAFERWRVPLAPFVIGFVLAPVAEYNLGAGLQLAGGSYLPLLTERLCPLFLLIAAGLLVWPLVSRVRQRVRPESQSRND